MKRLVLALMLVAAFAFVVNATAPPANGGYSAGWGMNPTNWQTATGSYNSGLALYDPLGLGGGSGWIVQWSPTIEYIDYDPITLELWIEMYMIQTYHNTSYKWHRLGNAPETITFTIDGTVESNEGTYVLMTADPNWDPNQLTFVENIGVGDDRNARDIPIIWEGRWGEGFTIGSSVQMPWTVLTWSGDELILDEITACDRWFQFRGTFDLVYHEADGYYYLVIAGCPSPSM